MKNIKKIRFVSFVVIIVFIAQLFLSGHLYCLTENAKKAIIDIYYKRSVRLYKQHKFDRAKEGFEKILELEPGHTKAQRYAENIARRINKEIIFGFYDQAKRHLKNKQYREAINSYREVLNILPGDEYSRFQIEALEGRIRKIEQRQERIRAAEERKRAVLEERQARRARKKMQAELRRERAKPRPRGEIARIEAKKDAAGKEGIAQAERLQRQKAMFEDLDKLKLVSGRKEAPAREPLKKEYGFTIQFTKEDDVRKDKGEISLDSLKQLEEEMIKNVKDYVY